MKRKTISKQIRDLVFSNSGGFCECSNTRHKGGICYRTLDRYDCVFCKIDPTAPNEFIANIRVICPECRRVCYPHIQPTPQDIEKAIRKARLKNL
jgi:hypothetical protein